MGTNNTWQERFNTLFNKKDFAGAYRFLESLHDEHGGEADYWLKAALCKLQVPGELLAAELHMMAARACPNWTPAINDAHLRDQVIYAIKFGGDLDDAQCTLHGLVERAPDNNLRACYLMIQARLLAKQASDAASRQQALALHRKADGLWCYDGIDENGRLPREGSDEQWIANNRWHWLVEMYRLRGILARHRFIDYKEVEAAVLTDPDIRRRRAVRLLRMFGRPVAMSLPY